MPRAPRSKKSVALSSAATSSLPVSTSPPKASIATSSASSSSQNQVQQTRDADAIATAHEFNAKQQKQLKEKRKRTTAVSGTSSKRKTVSVVQLSDKESEDPAGDHTVKQLDEREAKRQRAIKPELPKTSEQIETEIVMREHLYACYYCHKDTFLSAVATLKCSSCGSRCMYVPRQRLIETRSTD